MAVQHKFIFALVVALFHKDILLHAARANLQQSLLEDIRHTGNQDHSINAFEKPMNMPGPGGPCPQCLQEYPDADDRGYGQMLREEARQMFQGMFAWARQNCKTPCSEDDINDAEAFYMQEVERLPIEKDLNKADANSSRIEQDLGKSGIKASVIAHDVSGRDIKEHGMEKDKDSIIEDLKAQIQELKKENLELKQASVAEDSTGAASCDLEALGKCATAYSEAYSRLDVLKLYDATEVCPLLTTYSTCIIENLEGCPAYTREVFHIARRRSIEGQKELCNKALPEDEIG